MQDISESEWPAFLYPQGTNPDVKDDQAGLFRGYLLVFKGPVRSGFFAFFGRTGNRNRFLVALIVQ